MQELLFFRGEALEPANGAVTDQTSELSTEEERKVKRFAFLFVAGLALGGAGQQPLAAQTPVALVATKPPRLVQPPQPVRPGATPQPLGTGAGSDAAGQTKIVMTYRGSGRFDAGLALKLQPILAKRFGRPPPASTNKTPMDWLKTVLGQGDASDSPSRPRAVERTGPP